MVKSLQDNINAIPRESLNKETPYNLTKKLYPELIEKLNCTYINQMMFLFQKMTYFY